MDFETIFLRRRTSGDRKGGGGGMAVGVGSDEEKEPRPSLTPEADNTD